MVDGGRGVGGDDGARRQKRFARSEVVFGRSRVFGAGAAIADRYASRFKCITSNLGKRSTLV
jgi:hypothetical protein